MPAIQYTPIKFPRGRAVHANLIYDSKATPCGKSIAGGVRIVDSIITCTACLLEMGRRRQVSHRAAVKRNR